MSTVNPAEVIAEALAEHKAIKIPRPDAPRQCPNHVACQGCDWISRECGEVDPWDEHAAHQASVIAALPNIAIVPLNEPDANDRIRHWKVGDISVAEGTGLVWCDLEPTVHHHSIARVVAANLLSAAKFAGGES